MAAPLTAQTIETVAVTSRNLSRKALVSLGRGEEFMRDFPEPARDSPGWVHYFLGLAATGQTAECRARISEYCEQFAPDHLILLMGFRGIDDTSLERAIGLAGTEVLRHWS